jgi:hypothetical protein
MKSESMEEGQIMHGKWRRGRNGSKASLRKNEILAI